MPANTAIKVCSRASILMGGSPISSFDEGTSEADVVDAMYEDIARASLTSTRWRFSTNQQVLSRLSADPTGRYSSAYQRPSDVLMISAITVQDSLIKYDTYADKIFCDTSTSDVVVADYIFRAVETYWPSYFTLAVEFQVAAMLAISVARDPSLATMLDQQAERQMIKARRLDSQQQTTRKLDTSRFIAQRRS
tara:strand:- start:56 stop:634 length:579 start_codon:yes stop_codon:yes gene_type:complete